MEAYEGHRLYTKEILRMICKQRGYVGYSRLCKEELWDLCMVGRADRLPDPPHTFFSRKTMRQRCKDRGIAGYSRLDKKKLYQRCMGPSPYKAAHYTKAALYKKARAKNIPNRSKMTKDQLYRAVYG